MLDYDAVGALPPRGSVVLHTEASSGFGGQEIRILEESRWLTAHGWPAVIACQPGSRLFEEARRVGLPVFGIRMRHAADPLALAGLISAIRRTRAAIVHTHSSVDSWLATPAARLLGRAVVRSRHVSIPVRRWRALVYRLPDRVITSAEAVRAMLVAAGVPVDRVSVVPAGIDTTRFHAGVDGSRVRAELGLTGPVVGLVANLRGSKGHAVFLEAARAVLETAPGTRFLIVGDGVGAARIRRLIAEHGLDGAVLMTGFRRDIPEVMAALDVLVLPSTRTEAIPQVVMQALAVGTPVVATCFGGIPEIVRDGETGTLVAPGDARALARAIAGALADPARARAMARAGQAMVHRELTLEQAMSRTLAVYAEALAARG
jgi:glycosyltransferase involved in cell wall biosynthesis